MARRTLIHEGTLVLDCEGLSKFVSDHEPEAAHGRTDKARLAWVLSGVWIVHIGDEEAKAASAMLINAGLHGHKYAIEAAVAETAQRQCRPVVMLTSDIDDMTKLCGDRVRLVAV